MAEKKTLKERFNESKKLKVAAKITAVVAAIGAGFAGGWFVSTKVKKGE